MKVKKKGVTDAEIPLTNQVQGPYCRVQTKKTRIVRYLLILGSNSGKRFHFNKHLVSGAVW